MNYSNPQRELIFNEGDTDVKCFFHIDRYNDMERSIRTTSINSSPRRSSCTYRVLFVTGEDNNNYIMQLSTITSIYIKQLTPPPLTYEIIRKSDSRFDELFKMFNLNSREKNKLNGKSLNIYIGDNMNPLIKQYIIDCIDNSDRGMEPLTTDQQRADFLMDTFKVEFYLHRKLTVYAAMAEYLAGLPSCCNVDYLPSKILKLGYDWQLLDDESTATAENALIESWFMYIGGHIISFIQMNATNKF